jgi:hypothetical protein
MLHIMEDKKSQSHITSDGQSVRLGVRRPSGTRDQFFFRLEILFRQLRVCYFVAPSLTRGRDVVEEVTYFPFYTKACQFSDLLSLF